VKTWRIGALAGLLATLLMIPIWAEANPSGVPSATMADVRPAVASPAMSMGIPVIKMNDDDPMYQPNSIRIVAGQTVEWQNDGQVSHSVTDDASRATNPVDALLPQGVKPFNSGNVMPGGTFRHTFTKPGRYRYFCLTHEMDKMVGEVIVESAGTGQAKAAGPPPWSKTDNQSAETERLKAKKAVDAAVKSLLVPTARNPLGGPLYPNVN
jgi:plastocyanin